MTALQESYDSREAKGSEKPEARVKFQKLLFFGQVRLSEEHQQVKREWRQLFDKWFEHELLRKPSPDGKLPASPVEAFKKWHEYYEAKRSKAVLDLLLPYSRTGPSLELEPSAHRSPGGREAAQGEGGPHFRTCEVSR